MATADLYIVAAGNGSRMNAKLPKALVPITDEPCLTSNLQQIGEKFRRVFIVTNVRASEAWQAYFAALDEKYPELANHILNLPIESGLGDGHATLHGLRAAEAGAVAEDIVVAWGDVFFRHAEIIDELLTACPAGSGLLPAVHEDNPYVALLVNEHMQCVSADFAKYGESHKAGLHDQSVFRFRRHRLMASLEEFITRSGKADSISPRVASCLFFIHSISSSMPGIRPTFTKPATPLSASIRLRKWLRFSGRSVRNGRTGRTIGAQRRAQRVACP